jgi:hypothetical protein
MLDLLLRVCARRLSAPSSHDHLAAQNLEIMRNDARGPDEAVYHIKRHHDVLRQLQQVQQEISKMLGAAS